MNSKLNIIVSALLLLLAPAVMAADVAIITLENGANVRLKDDFSWEYIITETVVNTEITTSTNTVTKAAMMTPASTTAIATTPVIIATSDTPVATTTTKLTAVAIAQPELLGSTAKDGIKVSLADTKWKNNKVGLIFDFDSSSSDHVTVVEVEVSFYNDQGNLIKKENLQAWEAIFRMPETYLRKGEHRQSDIFWVEGIDKQQWQKQLISLKIVEIKSR